MVYNIHGVHLYNGNINTQASSGKEETSTWKKSKKSPNTEDAQYTCFKEKFQELIQNHIPVKFQDYNFRDMKQADECKRAGVPKALKIVEGNIYVIKSFYKHFIHNYELYLFIKTVY